MRVFNCNASISAAIRAVALSKSTEAPEPRILPVLNSRVFPQPPEAISTAGSRRQPNSARYFTATVTS
jgi:hypothetical protein